jgi:hypothetical protein
MNDKIHPTTVALPTDALTEEEAAAVAEATRIALADVRERNRFKAELLTTWTPALRDLEEADASPAWSMAECLIAAANAYGWNESEDNRLARLAVCLIKGLKLPVSVTRHNKRPDVVRVDGYRINSEGD